MAWIEFHAARIKRLKKFQDFRKTLNWSTIEGLGFLGSFWGEVIELAEDGDITGWNPEYVAELTGLKAEPERVWEALLINGWIDERGERMIVHDWLDFAGTYLRSKYAKENRDKLVEIWSLHNRTYGNPIGSRLEVGCTLPNQTLPNQPTKHPPPLGAFEQIWSRYPRREGKKEAERHFRASVKTSEDWQAIQKALDNYLGKLQRERTEPQFVKMGSSWFNNWQDWVNYNGQVSVPKPTVVYRPPPEPEKPMTEAEQKAGLEFVNQLKATLSSVGKMPK